MYRRTLHVGLFGTNSTLETELRGIPPLNRFEHDIAAYASFDDGAFCSCDVTIVEGELWQRLLCEGGQTNGGPLFSTEPTESGRMFLRGLVTERRRQIDASGSSYSAVVVLATCAQMESWESQDYDLIDMLWPADMSDECLRFEFSHLQQAAKQAADFRLTSTYLDTAIDSVPELIWFKDAKGAHLKVNDAFCAVVGKTKEQIAGRGHYYIWDISPEEYAQGEFVCMESETETMKAGHTCLFDEEVKTKAGMRQLKTYKSPLVDEDGTVMGTVGIAHDVTDFGNVTAEMEVLIDALPFAMVIEDLEGTIINANAMTERFFSVSKEDLLGSSAAVWEESVFGIVPPDDACGRGTAEELTATIGDEQRIFVLEKTPVIDVFGNATGRLCIYRDVSDERKLQQYMEQAASTDYLTSLYNRRYCNLHLERFRGDKPLTLIMFDLDDFKEINDGYGHATGDEALVICAHELRSSFPEDLVMRWGGDEFVVGILGQRDVNLVRRTTEDLIARLRNASVGDSGYNGISVTAGIASTADSSVSIDALFRRADDALYQAKRAGKGRCFVARKTGAQ